MSISLGPGPIHAEAVLVNARGQTIGCVKFHENLQFWQTRIEIEVWAQQPGLHGIHIHELGSINPNYRYSERNVHRIPCDSLGGHYNPYGAIHGTHTDNIDRRHVGDMGNIVIDSRGYGRKVFWDRLIQLRGTYSVINKAVVLHCGQDDLGRATGETGHESRITGNSGPRIACGLIRKVV